MKRVDMWEIEYSYIIDWLDELDNKTVAAIFAALELLQQEGLNLGRPLVDTLSNTRVANLKELRPASAGNTEIRIIFAFDSARKAIMLLGGDKSKGKTGRSKWTGWYKSAIPAAEKIFLEHVKHLGENDG